MFVFCLLLWVFVAARGFCLVAARGFCLVAASRRFSLVATRGLLIAVASLVTEHGLWAHGLQQLWFMGSRAQAK